jgi:peptidyl-prolyl cis-trans isomerase B (cyclophilin B)
MEYILKTNKGDITIKLFTEEAPITTKNFMDYADSGFFNGTIFHRVIKNFMIQGGGFDTDFNEKETAEPIKNEADNGISNKKGTVAMARTMVIDSATAQFFINTSNNSFLDHTAPTTQGYGYCVFAEVTDGMDVVNEISKTKTTSKEGHDDVPKETIEIIEVIKK